VLQKIEHGCWKYLEFSYNLTDPLQTFLPGILFLLFSGLTRIHVLSQFTCIPLHKIHKDNYETEDTSEMDPHPGKKVVNDCLFSTISMLHGFIILQGHMQCFGSELISIRIWMRILLGQYGSGFESKFFQGQNVRFFSIEK